MRRRTVQQKCVKCGYTTEHRILETDIKADVPSSLRCIKCGMVTKPKNVEKKERKEKKTKEKS